MHFKSLIILASSLATLASAIDTPIDNILKLPENLVGQILGSTIQTSAPIKPTKIPITADYDGRCTERDYKALRELKGIIYWYCVGENAEKAGGNSPISRTIAPLKARLSYQGGPTTCYDLQFFWNYYVDAVNGELVLP